MRLILFILIVILMGSIQVSANRLCIIPLSFHNDNRINSLSSEAQDMLIMSSLIASQLWPNKLPIQIKFKVMLLSSFTEVKIVYQEKGIFHNFSLINKTLFNIFKRLGILKDIQMFLLNQLGLNGNDLGPFRIKDEGGLTLYLDKAPSPTTITQFNFRNTNIDVFLDKVNKLKSNEEKASNKHLTFTEVLLLVGPIHSFLFQALNTRNPLKIRSALRQHFNTLRQERNRTSYSPEQKVKIIQETIQLFKDEKDMNVLKAARRLNVNYETLRKWLDKAEKSTVFTERDQWRKRRRRQKQ